MNRLLDPRTARLRVRLPLVTILLSSALLLGGCLSPKPLTGRPSPQAWVLPDMPVERWGDNTCGAAALSAVMRYHGREVTESDLIPLLPTGRNGGVISIDLLLAARHHGFQARLVRGDEAMIRQALDSRQPVITMIRVANLPGVNRDLFHYLLIDGYDPQSDLYRVQFGDATERWLPIERLEAQWSATDYATLLLSPGAATIEAGNAPSLKRAVLLEEEHRDAEALELYETILSGDPSNALVWLNLGNVQARLGRSTEAEASYREALALAPGDRDVMNNLAWLLVTQRRGLDEAELLARRAATEIGPDAFLYLDTLGEVLRVRGACEEAVLQFEHALFSVPLEQRRFRPSILRNLGRAQLDCGMADEARASFEKADAEESEPTPDGGV